MPLVLRLLFFLFLLPTVAQAAIASPPPVWQQYKRATVEKRLGRKLKFKERIALSVVRGKLKRQHRRATRPRNGGPADGFAIASLVCGILGWFTGITAIPALILGFVSLSRFKRDPQYRTGKGMAIAGIILGGLVILLGLIILVLLLSGGFFV
ncbi:MAG: DUF4190 domain-containing protein [Bacteroidota bacterium]